MKKKKIIFGTILVFVLAAFVFIMGSANTDCYGDENTALNDQRQESVDVRTNAMERAEALFPAPYTKNFPIREVLVEYTKRQDLKNHPWYTYVFSDTGAITHYFVSTTLPVSTNAFLGATTSVVYSNGGNLEMDAPSLDGIYYGGSGSASSMNGWIFVDATTGALGVIYGCKIMTFDAPLLLETEPQLITINAE
jgi:hypothetical protein